MKTLVDWICKKKKLNISKTTISKWSKRSNRQKGKIEPRWPIRQKKLDRAQVREENLKSAPLKTIQI